jgi:integrase
MTLFAWLDQWLRFKKGKVENGSWAYYEDIIRRYLKPVSGVVRLADLTSLLVERLMIEMQAGGGELEKPVSVYGQRAALTVLRMVLKSAVKHRLIDSNPARETEKPKKGRREPHWWTPADAVRFLTADCVRQHRLYALFRLALDSGMRQGELFALRWDDVDWTAGVVSVRRSLEEVGNDFREKEPKTAAGKRRVPVAPATTAALTEHRKTLFARGHDVKTGPVFPTRNGTWFRKANFNHMFHKLVREAGVPRIRPYDLRHSAASMWLANGASIRAVAARLGHDYPAVTLRHYAHCLPTEQDGIAALSGRLLQSHG